MPNSIGRLFKELDLGSALLPIIPLLYILDMNDPLLVIVYVIIVISVCRCAHSRWR